MKSFSGTVLFCLALGSTALASESLDRARQMLKSGDSLAAKTLLAQVAQRNPNDLTSLSEYAEFLEHHGDPAARAAYEKVLSALGSNGDAARRQAVSRQLVKLDLLAGDQVAAKAAF